MLPKSLKEAAQELSNVQINYQHKIIILDVKNLYVNLPIENITNITKFWLSKNNSRTIVIKQTLELIRVILNQNYVKYND
jgi:hypothetical protein